MLVQREAFFAQAVALAAIAEQSSSVGGNAGVWLHADCAGVLARLCQIVTGLHAHPMVGGGPAGLLQAESHLTQRLFASMVRRIESLPVPAG